MTNVCKIHRNHAEEGDRCKENTENNIDGAQEDVQLGEVENIG